MTDIKVSALNDDDLIEVELRHARAIIQEGERNLKIRCLGLPADKRPPVTTFDLAAAHVSSQILKKESAVSAVSAPDHGLVYREALSSIPAPFSVPPADNPDIAKALDFLEAELADSPGVRAELKLPENIVDVIRARLGVAL